MVKCMYKRFMDRPRFSASWIRNTVEGYLAHLETEGYCRSTLKKYGYLVLLFADYARQHGRGRIAEFPRWVDPFLMSRKTDSRRRCASIALNSFLKYLREQHLVARRAPKSERMPFPRVCADYLLFLREQRNLCERSITAIRSLCRCFFQHARDCGIRRTDEIGAQMVYQFLTKAGEQCGRHQMNRTANTLRGLLHYLHSTGRTRQDLASVVVSPRIYRNESCPRFLTRHELNRLLTAVDRRTRIGKRDYALLLLLATYGIRGMEATRLKLDDIDWRMNKIHIRKRKCGDYCIYPLSVSVGTAILSYLQHGRPKSGHRELFLSHYAPHGPMSTCGIGYVVRKRFKLSGVTNRPAGAYVFRYSCAQTLLEHDFPLKTISDYLGHHRLQTTHGYMKIDLKHLREVALNIGESLL